MKLLPYTCKWRRQPLHLGFLPSKSHSVFLFCLIHIHLFCLFVCLFVCLFDIFFCLFFVDATSLIVAWFSSFKFTLCIFICLICFHLCLLVCSFISSILNCILVHAGFLSICSYVFVDNFIKGWEWVSRLGFTISLILYSKL